MLAEATSACYQSVRSRAEAATRERADAESLGDRLVSRADAASKRRRSVSSRPMARATEESAAAPCTRAADARPLVQVDITMDRTSIAVAAIVVAQAVWLSFVFEQGWYLGADFARLAAANDQRLGWAYLSTPLAGHFGPLGRLIFWILNRAAPLNWDITVAARVLLQAIATVLLYRLLVYLVGRRPWLPAVLAGYAFSPLLIPGLAWLTSGVGLAISQVFVLLTLHAYVRYTRSGRMLDAVATGVYFLVAIELHDQSILAIVVLPILSLGFLHTGSFSDRLKASMHRWPSSLAVLAALGVFAGFYASGSYNSGSSKYGVGDAWQVAHAEWLNVLGPSLVGGPWRWSHTSDVFISYADPPPAAVLLGQLILVSLIAVGVRQTGKRALVAWLMPAVVAIGEVVLAGLGRYETAGTFIAPFLRYSFDAAVMLPLAIVLAFTHTVDERVPSPVGGNRSTDAAPLHPVLYRPITPVFLSAILVGASIVSGIGFAKRYSQNPSKSYVNNLIASARTIDPEASVYDSAVRGDVVPIVESQHYVSDILTLAGVRVHYDNPSSEPLVAGPDGRFVPSTFVHVADAAEPRQPGCGTHIGGKGTFNIPLSADLPRKDWYLRIELYQPEATQTISLAVLDRNGSVLRPPRGSVLTVTSRVEALYVRLPFSAPKALVITSENAKTTMCLVHTYVGAPLPRGSP
jgi:hypothetical protein